MSQMTDDMARNVVSNWERNRTRYGLTAWEECQLAHKWLSAADALEAQAARIIGLKRELYLLVEADDDYQAGSITAEQYKARLHDCLNRAREVLK
jgi:hypothetical protein